MLRTRSPLDTACIATHSIPFDLHVLSTPPAFVLSQNQTLQKYFVLTVYKPAKLTVFVISRTPACFACSAQFSLLFSNDSTSAFTLTLSLLFSKRSFLNVQCHRPLFAARITFSQPPFFAGGQTDYLIPISPQHDSIPFLNFVAGTPFSLLPTGISTVDEPQYAVPRRPINTLNELVLRTPTAERAERISVLWRVQRHERRTNGLREFAKGCGDKFELGSLFREQIW